MARTDLTVQPVTIAGATPSYAAANVDGHAVANTGHEFLHVKNGGGAPITVTIVTPLTVGGRAVADDTVTVPNGGERMIGPFSQTAHSHPSGSADASEVHVNFSAITSVTVAAFKVAQ